jgi:hypothetical protein
MFDLFGQDEELQDATPAIPESPAITEEVTAKDPARKLMDTWLDIHHEDPYLKLGDAEALAHLTGLSAQQVRTYMNNARARKIGKGSTTMSRNTSAISITSVPSSSSLLARKGRRKHRSSSTSLASLAKMLPSKSKIYQCTWCCGEAFGRKSDWKRHEQSTHYPQEEWICMPSYPIRPDEEGFPTCTFCDMRLDDPSFMPLSDESTLPSSIANDDIEGHLQKQHNFRPCFDKPMAERTFTRKDKLQQHMAQIHNQYVLKEIMTTDWKQAVNRNVHFTCGFCGTGLDGWNERANHIASHFEEGENILTWLWPGSGLELPESDSRSCSSKLPVISQEL